MSRLLYVLVGIGVLPLMSCIITREPTYEDPVDLPSVVLGTTESPMSEICLVDLDTLVPGPDGGPVTHPCLRWVVNVRDRNIDQPLEAVIYLNRQPDLPAANSAIGNPAVMRTQDVSRRLQFDLQPSQLSEGCNRLEVHVAESFSPFPDFLPPEDAEVAIGYFWIAARRGATAAVDMTQCQSRGDVSQ